MQDYSNMAASLRKSSMMYAELDDVRDTLYLASIAIEDLMAGLNRCRNELCLRCGLYAECHKGACDDCYWKEDKA